MLLLVAVDLGPLVLLVGVGPLDESLFLHQLSIERVDLILEGDVASGRSLAIFKLPLKPIDLASEHSILLLILIDLLPKKWDLPSCHRWSLRGLKSPDGIISELQLSRVIINHLSHGISELIVLTFDID